MKKRFIYVILSKTSTRPAKIIRRIIRANYSHSSISLDANLNEMYSFARIKYQTPLIGGFIHETYTTLSLGRDEEVPIKIFKIPVTYQQYKDIKKNIKYFKKNQKKFIYNYFSLILYPVHINFKIRDSYICTGFVSQMLAQAGIKTEEFATQRISPSMIVDILSEYEYYTGSLSDYVKTVKHKDNRADFLKRENFFVITFKSIKQILQLIFRKIT